MPEGEAPDGLPGPAAIMPEMHALRARRGHERRGVLALQDDDVGLDPGRVDADRLGDLVLVLNIRVLLGHDLADLLYRLGEELLEDNDVSALPLGRTEIDGDDVYVTVMEAEPTPGEGRAFETQSRYMDLQMDLEGAELCEVALGDVEEAEPYDEEKDFALWNGAASAALVLGEGRFAVFMVEEPHKPAIKAQGCDKVTKAVFKIAY